MLLIFWIFINIKWLRIIVLNNVLVYQTSFYRIIGFSSVISRCVSLNNDPCMIMPTLIDSNPVELNYYSFLISLDKCSGSCNAADGLSTKICDVFRVRSKGKNVKVFNMITKINEAKTLVKHMSNDFKCKLDSTTCNSNQKGNNERCQCEWKNYHTCKKYYSWNPSTCICENDKYLKSFDDTSLNLYDKITKATDCVSINVTNTVTTNMTNINKCHEYYVNNF